MVKMAGFKLLIITINILFYSFFISCGDSTGRDIRNEGTNVILIKVNNYVPEKDRVGFALEDTILFSTPNYNKAFSQGLKPPSYDFWAYINSSDEENSIVKKKTLLLIKENISNGNEAFIIISTRQDIKGDVLKDYLGRLTGIPTNHIFFEKGSKAARMVDLKLDFFYGMRDQDIEEALASGVKPIRIIRNKNSIDNSKYSPGNYYEEIIEGSDE